VVGSATRRVGLRPFLERHRAFAVRRLIESELRLTPEPFRAAIRPEAHRAAVERILAPDTMARSVAVVAEHRGDLAGLAIATQVPNFFDRVPEGFLHTFELEASGDYAEPAIALLEAIEGVGRAREWRYIRARRPTAAMSIAPFDADHGWELSSIRLRKMLRERPRPSTRRAGIRVRGAEVEDLSLMAALTADAIRAGLCPCERAHVTEELVHEGARRYLAALASPAVIALIAEVGGVPAAQAIGLKETADEFSGVVEGDLRDTYVLPAYRAEGLGRLLTACVEELARLAGRTGIRGEVAGGSRERMQGLLEELAGDGWMPDIAMLVKPLVRR
jgi:GNAT superfamily N-acetyltransferase